MAISAWEQSTYFAPKDVVIIGCGFVGLWTALELINKYPKMQITILERGVIPSGASTRNAGFSCFGSVSELMYDIALMGEANMLETVKMRYDGLQKIQRTFDKKVIDYDQFGGYELFEKNGPYEIKQLDKDIAYLNKILAPVLKTPKKNGKYMPIYSNESKKIKQLGFQAIEALAFSPLEGQLNSAKLVLALQQAVQSKGVHILFNTEVKKFKSHKKGVTIHTNLEAPLETKQLLICTNGFAKQLMPGLDVVPARGQVFITEPIPNLKFKGKNPKIELRWSGTMGMGKIKKPIIEEVQPNIFCAVRMSGMGVAIAPIVAERVVKLMKG